MTYRCEKINVKPEKLTKHATVSSAPNFKFQRYILQRYITTAKNHSLMTGTNIGDIDFPSFPSLYG